MTVVKYDDLRDAFEFVSFGAPMEHRAFIALDTGRVYWVSELNPIEEEDVPEDLGEPDRYLEVPHKNDLDLGRNLVFRFVEAEMPEAYGRVQGFFSHRGAYARFKDFLSDAGRLEQWYEFENQSADHALKEWCDEHQIQLLPSNGQST